MREIVLNKMMSFAGKGSYSNDELERMRYGFEAIYIFITKSVIIFTIAYFIGILKATLLFLVIYGIIRSFACGVHANKSWICLLLSGMIFIGLPYLCLNVQINLFLKFILCMFSLISIYKYAPADTKKRPIINMKKRTTLKYISLIIAILYIVLSFIIKNDFINNIFILSLFLESLMITPFTYKFFNSEFDNYKNYKSS